MAFQLVYRSDQMKGGMSFTCSMHVQHEDAYNILVGKAERKRPFGRNICRWVANIKMYLKEIGCVDVVGFYWLRRVCNVRLL